MGDGTAAPPPSGDRETESNGATVGTVEGVCTVGPECDPSWSLRGASPYEARRGRSIAFPRTSRPGGPRACPDLTRAQEARTDVAWPVFTEQPTLVGHRGMGRGVVDGYCENTIESFLAALACGIDWVEVDVRRTSDDGLFVCHDAALPDGVFLSDVTSSQAVKLGIVRLEELLEALPGSAGVVFDVKSSLADAGRSSEATTAALLARTCSRALGDRPALAQSFDPAALLHMRQALPDMALGLLTWARFPVGFAVAAAAHLDVEVLAVHAGSLVPGALTGITVPTLDTILTAVHDSKRQLMVWCPSPRRVRPLLAAGVDAIVVDDLPRHVRKTA